LYRAALSTGTLFDPLPFAISFANRVFICADAVERRIREHWHFVHLGSARWAVPHWC
jgi:hypothetical protein